MTAQVGRNSLAKQSQFCFVCRHSFRRLRTHRWQFFPPRCAVIEVGQFILGERRHLGTCSFFLIHVRNEPVLYRKLDLVNGQGRDWWLAIPRFVPKVALHWVFDWSYIWGWGVGGHERKLCVSPLAAKTTHAFSLLAGSLPHKGYYGELGLSCHSVHEWIHNDFFHNVHALFVCQHVAKERLEA